MRRPGLAAFAVLAAASLAAAQSQPKRRPYSFIMEPFQPLIFVRALPERPWIFAQDVRGASLTLLEFAAYDHELRELGLTPEREEAIHKSARLYGPMRANLLSDIAELQHELEKAPAPGTGLSEEGMSWALRESSRDAMASRRPADADFARRPKAVPEHERHEEPRLEPGALEFKP